MKLYHRYIFKKLSFTLLFILCAIFIVYILMDLSIHSSRFISSKNANILDIIYYYIHFFMRRIDLLSALALLLSTIYVIASLNIHHELVAFQMAGISKTQLLKPFFIYAAGFSLITLITYQCILPRSIDYIATFKEQKLLKKASDTPNVYNVVLQDGSKFVYGMYNKTQSSFDDVFWIFSSDDIWHIDHLDKANNHPIGHNVTHFCRAEDGSLIKREFFNQYLFNQIESKQIQIKKTQLKIEQFTLLELMKNYFASNRHSTKRLAEIRTQLNYRLILSLTPFLVVSGVSIPAFRFSRKLSIFFLTMVGLFIFMFYYALLDALALLGENRVSPPFITFWGMFFLSYFFLGLQKKKT